MSRHHKGRAVAVVRSATSSDVDNHDCDPTATADTHSLVRYHDDNSTAVVPTADITEVPSSDPAA